MDDPAIGREEHEHALRGLARINAVSRAWGPLLAAMRAATSDVRGPVRVLDVATGSGDVPIALAKRFAGASWHACDISEQALAVAKEKAGAAGVELATFRCDVVNEAIAGEFDVVMCSLFLHHLEPSDVMRALRHMAQAARGVVLVHDLRRTRAGLALAHVVPRLLPRSRVVHVDAVKSVRGAYTMEELREMAAQAGLSGARVHATFPQRMMLAWRAGGAR